MAATLTAPKPVKKADRLRERKRIGDYTSMYEIALEEQADGNLINAKAALREALTLWLYHRWVEVSGKTFTPIRDPDVLACKLRSSGTIDTWTHKLIVMAVNESVGNAWLQVDLLIGVVSALCFGFPTVKRTGGEL